LLQSRTFDLFCEKRNNLFMNLLMVSAGQPF